VNLIRFRENFLQNAHIVFPKPIYATKNVLVESWEGGEPIGSFFSHGAPHENVFINAESNLLSKYKEVESDAASGRTMDNFDELQRREIARMGVGAFFKMMMIDNFVHADLHPGNISVRQVHNPSTGHARLSLVFYDVGFVTEAHPTDWDHWRSLFRSIISADGLKTAELFLSFSENHKITFEDESQFKSEMMAIFAPLQGSPFKASQVGLVLRQVRYNVML